MLIDFGAARQTLALDTPMLLKLMYTPGFASWNTTSALTLGPWSDIYSIGA